MEDRVLTDSEREEISDYLSLNEDLLYSLIPPFLPEYRGTLFMTEGQIVAGKQAFEERKPMLRTTLCDEWKLCEKMRDPSFEDTVRLISTIGDVIALHTGGIPPFLVGSLLIKIGVRKFCNCGTAK